MSVKKGAERGTLTLTIVRIAMVDSNVAFAGMIPTVFLAAVRAFMFVFKTVVIAGLDSGSGVGPSTIGGSKVIMLQGRGRRTRWKAEDR